MKCNIAWDGSRMNSDERGWWSWAALSQLIFIVIFSRRLAIRVVLICKVILIKFYRFLRKRVNVRQSRQFFVVSPSAKSIDPRLLAQKRKKEAFAITIIQFISYVLIWWNWFDRIESRQRNERALNFIHLNCIICITNTLIEKIYKWNESDIWHDCLC